MNGSDEAKVAALDQESMSVAELPANAPRPVLLRPVDSP
jgi:hypothetical protein